MGSLLMRLTEKYRPWRLADIVGQPTHKLRWLVKSPSRSCWLLEGEPGTGKSATAHALANELGSDMTTYTYTAGALSKETISSLFTRWLRYVPPSPARMNVLVIEEFERCVSADARADLKAAIDRDVDSCDGGLPQKAVVIATSNDVTKIEPALLERFNLVHFASGPEFASACQDRMAQIWQAECPDMDMPHGWLLWGWQGNLERFSMRVAMRELEEYVGILESLNRSPVAACA
jgi:SpoVK/Ycf46/Vps4 family AAA+-type ATPase